MTGTGVSADGASPARAERVIRGTAVATVAYLVATLVPMGRYASTRGDWLPLIGHIAALGIAWAVVYRPSPGWRRIVRDWLPLALSVYLYVELRWLIAGVGQPHADATLIRWEQFVFPGDPSRSLAQRFPGELVSELLHACYLAYYALVVVPPALLYLRGRREAFAQTMLPTVLAFGICFVGFMAFPVDGPRFLVGPADAPAGPIRTATLQLLSSASSRGTAFPSAHVAVALVASISSVRFLRPAGYVVALVAAGLAVATVYGGFHYGVDVIAGLAVGLIAVGVSHAIWRAADHEVAA